MGFVVNCSSDDHFVHKTARYQTRIQCNSELISAPSVPYDCLSLLKYSLSLQGVHFCILTLLFLQLPKFSIEFAL